MDVRQVPSVLADVAGPLREAAEYERLQLERQRGLYNILTGLPFLFFIGLGAQGIRFAVPVAAALFILSCSTPKLLLPYVRRRRPDWVSPLLESSLVKRALEKQFWVQAPFAIAWIFAPVAFVLVVLASEPNPPSVLRALSWFWASLHVGATVTLALHARKLGDRLVERLFWIMTVLAPIPLFRPIHQSFDGLALALFLVAVAGPPLMAGAFRMLAPRRWLVR